MIEQTIQSPEGGEQRLFICETPINEDGIHVTVHGLDDIARIQAANKEKYGKLKVDIPTWNAPTLHVRGREVPSDLSKLELYVSSALHSQAIRSGSVLPDDLPVTVIGVLELADGSIYAGIRRGAVQGNKVSLIPLGYEDAERYKGAVDPDMLPHTPFEQLYQEGIEEAGMGRYNLAPARLLGAQVDHFTNGLNLVFYARAAAVDRLLRLPITPDAVLAGHGAALAIYQGAQRRTLSEGQPAHKARKVGHAAVEAYNFLQGFDLPVDAGDHFPLVFIAQGEIPDTLAQDGRGVVNVLNGATEFFPLMSPTKGALFIYDFCRKEGILKSD
jgi:hypothetical protein